MKDSNGIPAPRVVYSFSENTRRMLQRGAQAARELLQAAGATDIHEGEPYPWTSHFMGTARMGTDPKRSVVNAWHHAHDVPNLFIVDGSHQRCGGPNPYDWSARASQCRRDLGATGEMDVTWPKAALLVAWSESAGAPAFIL